MFKPVSLIGALIALVAFVASLITILAVWEPFEPLVNKILKHSTTVNSAAMVFIVLLLISIPILILNSKLYYARAKLQNAELELSTKSALLDQSELLRMTDVVTGIPNQEQFFRDLQVVTKSISYAKHYQLIFVDLNNFGEINKRYGYAVGDQLIEFFAKSVYETMRRNETVYKMPFDEKPEDSELWQRAYRKHTGGDEFLFLIGGEEADAVGFLVRLQRRIISELNVTVQNEILKSADWSLSFSAAVLPVFPNDTKEDVLQRAHEGMRVARQAGSKSRVFWSTRQLPDELEEGWRKTVYEDAIEFFSPT